MRAVAGLAHTDDLIQILKAFLTAIIGKRRDWNGEVLSIRASDLINLSFAMGIEQADLFRWLSSENYLIKGINHSLSK
jgi:hypothetical protein